MLRIRFEEAFSDFNILKEKMKPGQEIDVEDYKVEQIKQSGGMITVVGFVVPPHVPAEPEEPKKVSKRGTS